MPHHHSPDQLSTPPPMHSMGDTGKFIATHFPEARASGYPMGQLFQDELREHGVADPFVSKQLDRTRIDFNTPTQDVPKAPRALPLHELDTRLPNPDTERKHTLAMLDARISSLGRHAVERQHLEQDRKALLSGIIDTTDPKA